MSGKSVIIVGGGISGLTAGVYAARCGFKTLILEKCATPGGVSTCWVRKGYQFEGGVHWLTGSAPDRPLNQVWKGNGALRDNNPVYNKDPFFVLVLPGGELPLYRNPEKMKATLLQHAPEDRKAIRRLYRHIKWFKNFHTPVTYLRGLRTDVKTQFNPMEFIRMFPALTLTPGLWARSVKGYVERFRNKDLRALLGGIMNPEHNALSFIVTLSSFAYGDSGYPSGGSLMMARNMEETFLREGGEIRYNTIVKNVRENADGRKMVTLQNGETLECDAVIISADARAAIDHLFDEPLQDGWARKMRKKLRTGQCMFIGMGVKADLRNRPKSMVFPLEKPFEAGPLKFTSITVHNYATDAYAPEGCTVLSVLLLGDSYSYWKQARENGSYNSCKDDISQRCCALVEELIPEARGCIEICNMATPLTVQRYCLTHEGSYMAVWNRRTMPYIAPIRYRKGIYFAGQRTSLSGGLPIAAQTGHKVVQYLCRDFDEVFVTGLRQE